MATLDKGETEWRQVPTVEATSGDQLNKSCSDAVVQKNRAMIRMHRKMIRLNR
jgi:hypothetical protein